MAAQRRLTTRRGFTIIEVMIAAGLLSLALLGTLALLVNMLNIWCKGASGTSANSYASIAMRKLVTEIEEGMSATAGSDGQTLTVTFPYRASSTSDYNRAQTGVVVTYYLSGATGSESSGTYLWKSVGATKTRLARNVEIQSLTFSVTSGKLVRITLVGYDREGGAYSPNLIQQSVKLRNG